MSDFISNKMNYLIRLITREMEIDWDIHCAHSEYPMYWHHYREEDKTVGAFRCLYSDNVVPLYDTDTGKFFDKFTKGEHFQEFLENFKKEYTENNLTINVDLEKYNKHLREKTSLQQENRQLIASLSEELDNNKEILDENRKLITTLSEEVDKNKYLEAKLSASENEMLEGQGTLMDEIVDLEAKLNEMSNAEARHLAEIDKLKGLLKAEAITNQKIEKEYYDMKNIRDKEIASFNIENKEQIVSLKLSHEIELDSKNEEINNNRIIIEKLQKEVHGKNIRIEGTDSEYNRLNESFKEYREKDEAFLEELVRLHKLDEKYFTEWNNRKWSYDWVKNFKKYCLSDITHVIEDIKTEKYIVKDQLIDFISNIAAIIDNGSSQKNLYFMEEREETMEDILITLNRWKEELPEDLESISSADSDSDSDSEKEYKSSEERFERGKEISSESQQNVDIDLTSTDNDETPYIRCRDIAPSSFGLYNLHDHTIEIDSRDSNPEVTGEWDMCTPTNSPNRSNSI